MMPPDALLFMTSRRMPLQLMPQRNIAPPSGNNPQMLSPTQLTAWQRDGYLVLPGFKSQAEVAAACHRADELVEAFDPSSQASRFCTRDRSQVVDAALLASANTVRCFFEEEALDVDGALTVPKAQSINKIGHALHDLDPVYQAFSHDPELDALAHESGLAQPRVWQSQLIFKQPRIGGEVGWHQDASFFVKTPQTVTTFWFAQEDATLDNGCLWAEPGGHIGAPGVLREQYVCDHAADAAYAAENWLQRNDRSPVRGLV